MSIGGNILRTSIGIKSLVACLLFSVIAVSVPATLHAESSGTIAQGFPVDTRLGEIVTGSLVSHKSGSQSVELATVDSADRLAGVADANPLLAITGEGTEIQVVLGGTTSVLVSDINGAIRAGDKITASPIAGIGMKATTDARVAGTAQSNFDTKNSETKSITDTGGNKHTVRVSYLDLQVGLAYFQAPGGSDFLPPFLQNFANNIAGKEVSLVRITFSAILLLFSFISLGILISSTVRSAITSLGRNPLAALNIRKSLYQVGGIAVAALVGTLVACYLILVL